MGEVLDGLIVLTKRGDLIYSCGRLKGLNQVTLCQVTSVIITVTKFFNLIGSWHTLFFTKLEHAQLSLRAAHAHTLYLVP